MRTPNLIQNLGQKLSRSGYHFGRFMYKLEGNIKIDIKEVWCENMYWIQLLQAFVNMAMNLLVL
jgi:hypothetical protein